MIHSKSPYDKNPRFDSRLYDIGNRLNQRLEKYKLLDDYGSDDSILAILGDIDNLVMDMADFYETMRVKDKVGNPITFQEIDNASRTV